MSVMALRPETNYTKADGLNIAYQVVGEGPLDLVYIPGFVSHVELAWEEPLFARFADRLASFSRLILLDKRGTGMSDRLPNTELPTLEKRVDDLIAVLDAVGSERPALFSHSEGGNMAAFFAAAHPQRTRALVTAGIFAARVWSEDYPWAPSPADREREILRIEENWGGTEWLKELAPSAGVSESTLRRIATYFRRSASPGAVAELMRINTQIDVREILELIQAPTLVMHRRGDRDCNIEEGRWIAERIPGATFVELDGDDHIPWMGDADTLLDRVEEFLTGIKGPSHSDRSLATVVLTDIVDSTTIATRLGDEEWRRLLERHDAIARRYVERYRGTLVKSTGDGFLATFGGPARGVECALAFRDAVEGLGLAIRVGIHTGEVENRGIDIGGIAVHIASRVEALASPGEVLVTRTVIDLISGSRLRFADRGSHELVGVAGSWQLATALS